MKLRMLSVLVITVLFVASLTLACDKGKGDCAAKTASAKKSACCMMDAKASLKTDAKSVESANAAVHVIPVSNKLTDEKSTGECAHNAKDCDMKTAKMSSDCAAHQANCDMAKSAKMTMKTKSGKMDCCKAKNVEAKNSTKQNKTSSDVKGTN